MPVMLTLNVPPRTSSERAAWFEVQPGRLNSVYDIHQPGIRVKVEASLASEHVPAELKEQAPQYGYAQ